MVAHFGLRTHELLYKEILSAWEKAECYEKLAYHSQRIFTLIIFFVFFLHLWQDTSKKFEKLLFWIRVDYVENGCYLDKEVLNFQSFHRNIQTDLSLVRIVKWATI